MAETTGKSTVSKIPQPHGGALNSGGTPGNKGGRPPDAFKEMCRSLASSQEVEEAVKAILKDKTHPAFVGALKWATENGYGKAAQPIVGDPDRPIEHKVQVWQFGSKRVQF